jgi:transposase-like protein
MARNDTRNKVDPAEAPSTGRSLVAAGTDTPEQELAQELLVRAREEAIDLVGPDGMLTKVTKSVLEAAFGAELTEHLGYEAHDAVGRGSGNSRNGTIRKVVHTDVGPVTLEIPRDREGTFSPVIVPKHSRRLDGFDEAIVSLYAKGLTTGEIQDHLDEVYGAEVSKDTISRITEEVNAEALVWQDRPLDALYPVIFIDAIVVKIRDGAVANRPNYVAMAVTMDGERDVLGLWVGNGGEGAKHWLNVLTEIKNRDVNDVLIVCCDGLNGPPESITAVWPAADVQTCLVHLVCNTLLYTSRQHWAKITKDLRTVYTAPTLDAATERFAEFEERWGPKYPAAIGLWRSSWEEFIPFLSFPSEIRLHDQYDQRHRIAQRPLQKGHSNPRPLPQRDLSHQDPLSDYQDPRHQRR